MIRSLNEKIYIYLFNFFFLEILKLSNQNIETKLYALNSAINNIIDITLYSNKYNFYESNISKLS